MALQNIGAANRDDAFYRYKMPRMITKIEGRGNGIKTNVVNMVEIAKALARPASYTTKYFGCELGAQSKFDDKTGVSLVNGAHDTAKLAGLLENFIKKYVQCYGCGNPETEIVIMKTQMINLKCAACGFVSEVDMRDKLTTFIVKNPPEQKKSSKDKKALRRAEKERLKEGEAADEELRKAKKEVKKKASATTPKDSITKKSSSSRRKASASDEEKASPVGSQADENEDVGDGESDDDGVQWHTDTSLEAARLRIQEQLSAVTAEMVILNTTSEPESKPKKPEPTKTVTENKLSKKEEVPTQNGGAIKKQSQDEEDGEEQEEEATTETLKFEIKGWLKKGCTPGQLPALLGSLSGSQQEVMDALFRALFENAGKGFAKEVAKKKGYLAAAVGSDGSRQALLLRAIGGFCKGASAVVVKEVGLALKALYDADVLEEDYIFQWFKEGASGSTKGDQIWKIVKPFVEWLQSAESETEDKE
ncbi:eukaryotic translation initiation factor 5 [Amborella trichopoda]|uniref:W2 domain-containing protein n=1 Tax=Amborella trichopoda TaxID=13333 RepID=U5D111_AMBTC|nr:eukaryotic translation initiation factor 5 [Amborella trichopoda]XP_020529371.1 eukaryotic translation initiation factor 5 [Amborella trichopoda]ERN16114.1 hypothetical protein AMTR_s00030p00196280 [Amborella trichopoda]|eukprot:XP_006854647.1 eukaryotic translation initiation factor 5 [Amborella trichopoda]